MRLKTGDMGEAEEEEPRVAEDQRFERGVIIEEDIEEESKGYSEVM